MSSAEAIKQADREMEERNGQRWYEEQDSYYEWDAIRARLRGTGGFAPDAVPNLGPHSE